MVEEQELGQQEELSEQEIAERIAGQIGTTPTPEEKQNVHTFLHNVATSKNTTKTGYLDTTEIGNPRLPVRTYLDLALFCDEIADMDYYASYFRKKSEIITSSSLSKDAKLLNLAVLQKREVADVTPINRKPNRGWFKRKTEVPSAPPIN